MVPPSLRGFLSEVAYRRCYRDSAAPRSVAGVERGIAVAGRVRRDHVEVRERALAPTVNITFLTSRIEYQSTPGCELPDGFHTSSPFRCEHSSMTAGCAYHPTSAREENKTLAPRRLERESP